MFDDIAQIQASIQDIQDRIAALSTPAQPPATSVSAATPSFAQTLQAAQTAAPSAASPGSGAAPSGVEVPPASLGPLPPQTVAPMPVRVSSNAGYSSLVQTYAAKNNLDPSLVQAVIQTESGGDPKAVSSAGAMGLMQLMPSNVKDAGITDPFDPEQNIAAGTQQLSGLMQQYHGDLDLALAAYNAGPGNVRKYGGVPPFEETQNYIRKVRAAMQSMAQKG